VEVTFRRVDWEFTTPFRIAYESKTHAQTVVVELQDGGFCGRGEAMGVSYCGETIDTLLDQLASIASTLRNGLTRSALQQALPAGGARNAVDCALWDLEAKRAGRRAWELAGMRSVDPIITDYTIGIDSPVAMRAVALGAAPFSLLKLKLDGESDMDRVWKVREARPDARLTVDANQAWSQRQLRELAPQLADLGVELIEQPLPVDADAMLERYRSPVPLCADESCQTAASLPAVLGKYQYVNIKLDKAGGLTEALRLAQDARREGLGLMVGCMGGSSLAMAPAFVVGQLCTYADLDGPLLSKADIEDAIRYDGSRMFPPDARLWG